MRIHFIIFLLFPILSFSQEKELNVYFDHNKDQLNKQEIDKIKQLLEIQHLQILSLKAYCDTVGTTSYNLDLAQRRIHTVQSYLSKELLVHATMYVIGEDYPTENPIPLHFWRKVTILYQDEPIKIPEIIEQESVEPLKRSVFDSLTLESALAEDAAPIVLDIQFFPGMDVLMAESWVEIDRLFQFLKRNDQVHAFIRGHVCCGSDMYLSYARAYTVYNSLIKRGISPKRLELKGFDNTKPRVWPEVTDEDRQMNRRVDVIFSLPEE
jgi:outer membrane protein OmpA-like peptidoglycan-associated protein